MSIETPTPACTDPVRPGPDRPASPGQTEAAPMSRREFAETFGALALAVTGTIVLATTAEAAPVSTLPPA